MRDLDLPRGHERELVVDPDRVYELDGEDSGRLPLSAFFGLCGTRFGSWAQDARAPSGSD
jgi:hypothetical protein